MAAAPSLGAVFKRSDRAHRPSARCCLRVIARLARTISDALTASGWQTRPLGPPTGAALTRTTRNGIMATAQLTLTPFRGTGWPVEIGVRLGVGYEPALNLMPLLTLRPLLTLLDNPDTAGLPRTLHSAEDIDTTSRPSSPSSTNTHRPSPNSSPRPRTSRRPCDRRTPSHPPTPRPAPTTSAIPSP